jgi:hypothetical protein
MIISGLKVVTDINIKEFSPVIELSEKVMVSQSFREKCNKFYLDLFGEKRNAIIIGDSIFMHPNSVKPIMDAEI